VSTTVSVNITGASTQSGSATCSAGAWTFAKDRLTREAAPSQRWSPAGVAYSRRREASRRRDRTA